MKKKLFYLLWLAIPLVSCEKGGGIPDTPINPPIHPKTNNDTLAWNNLQSSTWDRDTDFFIGTKYANMRNRGMDNDPYIYVGGIYPEKTFLSYFDKEIPDSINPIDITFNFGLLNPYSETKSRMGRMSYLKILKRALQSKEYNRFIKTRGNQPHRARMAEIKSYEDIEKAFPDNIRFGKTIKEIVAQAYGEKHKNLSIGEVVFKNFTVSMEAPANGIFKNIHRKDSIDNPVYIRSITYGSVAYFIIESEHAYEDVFNAFRGIKNTFKDSYSQTEGILHNSKIILFTISDVSQETRKRTTFEDLEKYMENPYYNTDIYGYPIYCTGYYAKDNSIFRKK